MDTLNAEQQALFASIMGNSSQQQNFPVMPVVNTVPKAGNPNRVLSQAEIDALFGSKERKYG